MNLQPGDFEVVVLGGVSFFRFADGIVAVDDVAVVDRAGDVIEVLVRTDNPSVGLYARTFTPLSDPAAVTVIQG